MRENTKKKSVRNIVLQLLENYHCLEGDTIKKYLKSNIIFQNASEAEINVIYKETMRELVHAGIINQAGYKKGSKVSRRYKFSYLKKGIFKDSLIEGNSIIAIDFCLDVLLDLKKYQKIKIHKLYYYPSTIRYVVEDDEQIDVCYELLYLTYGNRNSILNTIKTLPSYEMNRIVVFKDDIPSAELDDFADELGNVVMFAQINDDGSISYFK